MHSTLTTTVPDVVIVHPLVLLSVVDHYKRASLVPGKRVVGVLLGYWTGGLVNVTNSYALPFEENENDPTVWYLDHNYHENMCELYKKINAKEQPVGWYHSGPKLRPSDQTINELFRKYCPNPILCIIDPVSMESSLPVKSYVALEELREDGSTANRTFAHVNSMIEAEEAEAVGVEHLLRDLKDKTIGSLSQSISAKFKSLTALDQQLEELDSYLAAVIEGKFPVNQKIISEIQDLFNLLPDVHSKTSQMSLTMKTNDQLAMIYVGSMARAVIALHGLVNNKLEILNSVDQPKSNQANNNGKSNGLLTEA